MWYDTMSRNFDFLKLNIVDGTKEFCELTDLLKSLLKSILRRILKFINKKCHIS